MWVGHGSLYRHFDKLGKEEQVQVLKDALGAYTLHNKPQTLHPQLQTRETPSRTSHYTMEAGRTRACS
jgi:hypothetical protein